MALTELSDSREADIHWNEELIMLEQIVPVDPEELLFAFKVGSSAAGFDMPLESPATKSVHAFDHKTGKTDEIRLVDNPMSRFMTSVANEFRHDASKFYSIMQRINALIVLMGTDERAKEYLKAPPGNREMLAFDNALIEVMAQIRFSESGEFDKDLFFNNVEEIKKNDNQT